MQNLAKIIFTKFFSRKLLLHFAKKFAKYKRKFLHYSLTYLYKPNLLYYTPELSLHHSSRFPLYPTNLDSFVLRADLHAHTILVLSNLVMICYRLIGTKPQALGSNLLLFDSLFNANCALVNDDISST